MFGAAVVLAGCGGSGTGETDVDAAAGADTGSGGASLAALPPVGGKLDYQLGGAYTPPTGVQIVSRDRNAATAPGLYNICYVNGFQIQPEEAAMWMTDHPDLILRDAGGAPIIDTEWNEMLIDISTPEKRAAVLAVERPWLTGCHTAGFDAIEIDNLDSYARSTGLLTEDEAVLMLHAIADVTHGEGLALAQKNSSELVARKAELGADFVVSEECDRYSECDTYRAGYGDHVLVIEYRRQDFTTGCSAYPELSIVLRDLDLVTPTDTGYVYDGC